MSVWVYNSHNHPLYRTHFTVPIDSNSPSRPSRPITHHTHFSIGRRKEGGVRDIAFKTHPIRDCNDAFVFAGGRLFDPRSNVSVQCGLPIEKVHDWTEAEVELFSSALCPETQAQYADWLAAQEEVERNVQEYMRELSERQNLQPREPSWAEQVEAEEQARDDGETTSAKLPESTEAEDFPLEFEDDNKCPACLEDEYTEETYLLRLPCGHTLCKGCLKGVEGKCPKCRKGIDRSLIKRKK